MTSAREMASDPFLSAEDVAAILNISRMAAYRLFSDPYSGLRCYRFGRTVRVRTSDLDRYIRNAAAL